MSSDEKIITLIVGIIKYQLEGNITENEAYHQIVILMNDYNYLHDVIGDK